MFNIPRHRRDAPIIGSLADMDFYKFTMAYFVFVFYRGVRVTYGLTNRTVKIRLADAIDIGELREQLEHIKTLRFNQSLIAYLRGLNIYADRMFSEEFLQFLVSVKLPDFHLEVIDGQYLLTFEGAWEEAIWWETLALSVINELYYRAEMKRVSNLTAHRAYATGVNRLADKIEALKKHPHIPIVEFGTRRRFSHDWQFYVLELLLEELGPTQLVGTSNVEFAYRTGLTPMGTNAHELPMVAAAMAGASADPDLFDVAALRGSQKKILGEWWLLYDYGLSVALTDTFGTDAFFQDFAPFAADWKGVRHDSGNPFQFVDKVLAFYRYHRVDPLTKLIIFSDGLDLPTILALAAYCEGKIRYSFGWGTNLTNDLGFLTLSLVIKVIMANGFPTVKLSDNLAKAMGPAAFIEAYKRVWGYTNTQRQECVV